MFKHNNAGQSSERSSKRSGSWNAHTNRNFMTRPIARDARTKLQWYSEPKNYLSCDLLTYSKGKPELQLWLPAEVKERHVHAPTAFDVAVLIVLLSACKKQGDTGRIKLPSIGRLLSKGLGVSAHQDNRKRFDDSLQYWQLLELEYYASWHQGRREDRSFRPLIKSCERDGQGRSIVLRKEWCDLGDKYWASVQLPVPLKAAEQNLVLLLLTMHGGRTWSTATWCRKIGLGRHHQAQALRKLLASTELREWLQERGFALLVDFKHRNRKVALALTSTDKTKVTDARNRSVEMEEEEDWQDHDKIVGLYYYGEDNYVSGNQSSNGGELKERVRKYPNARYQILYDDNNKVPNRVLGGREVERWIDRHLGIRKPQYEYE
jgi:hypothetical protein